MCAAFSLRYTQHKREQASRRGRIGAASETEHQAINDEEDEETDEDEIEARKAAEFFEDGDGDEATAGGGGGGIAAGGGVPFQQLNLSRPLLRAVEAMGFVNPTPIQQRAVPFALAGRFVPRCPRLVYVCLRVYFRARCTQEDEQDCEWTYRSSQSPAPIGQDFALIVPLQMQPLRGVI